MEEPTFRILESISIIIASGVAIYGIDSYRRENKWKRQYELIEEVLSLFYEARENISSMRSSLNWAGDGSTRAKGIHELPEETEMLNAAYSFVEKYEKLKDPFLRLKSLKYRFMAIFGNDSAGCFERIWNAPHEIIETARKIATRKSVLLRGAELHEHTKQKWNEENDEFTSILYSYSDAEDKFGKKIDDIVIDIEEFCKSNFL